MSDVKLDRGFEAQDAEPCATGAEAAFSRRPDGLALRVHTAGLQLAAPVGALRPVALADLRCDRFGVPLVNMERLGPIGAVPHARLDAVVPKTVVNTAGW